MTCGDRTYYWMRNHCRVLHLVPNIMFLTRCSFFRSLPFHVPHDKECSFLLYTIFADLSVPVRQPSFLIRLASSVKQNILTLGMLVCYLSHNIWYHIDRFITNGSWTYSIYSVLFLENHVI